MGVGRGSLRFALMLATAVRNEDDDIVWILNILVEIHGQSIDNKTHPNYRPNPLPLVVPRPRPL